MTKTDLLDRREFTLEAALTLLSGVAICVTGCGGSTSPAAPSPAPGGDVSGSIAANHGHTAVVTRAQLTSGNDLLLDIRGGANHPHTVQLSQGNLNSIANGQSVSVTSTVDQQHSHAVTFN